MSLLAALLMLFAQIAPALIKTEGPPPLETMVLHCRQSSFVGPEHAELHISRQGENFSDGQHRVDTARVAALMRALERPFPDLDPTELAPPPDELRRAGERCADSYSMKAAAKKILKQKLLEALADPAHVAHAVRVLYASHHTDDYPKCDVEIVLHGGAHLSAHSDAQQDYMIPWLVAGRKSFAPDIGRALAALLPARFLQRERLSGEQLAGHLASDIAGEFLR